MLQKTIFFVSLITLSSCASIVSKTSYQIPINSSPSDANITITNRKGEKIFDGRTPTIVKLRNGAGFFTKAEYVVKFEKEGYNPKTVVLTYDLNGWYFGNLVFGGLIGFLIVDPATGAMFRPDMKIVNETLSQATASLEPEEGKLKIYSIDEIPESWKGHLIKINE
jgi:hypothetical protein